ncbi:hypothetical protein [Methylocapsa acidiphila]|uniref:hypothetical protein n=1 Tax=Methylocapsa acidiphila TaxID=133552 RepID=UPI000402C616|nr:hypothetical protein [Methylocapsa acidiphila]
MPNLIASDWIVGRHPFNFIGAGARFVDILIEEGPKNLKRQALLGVLVNPIIVQRR